MDRLELIRALRVVTDAGFGVFVQGGLYLYKEENFFRVATVSDQIIPLPDYVDDYEHLGDAVNRVLELTRGL